MKWLTLNGDDDEIIRAMPSQVTGVELVPLMDERWAVRISKHSGRSGVTYHDKADAEREFRAALEACGVTP